MGKKAVLLFAGQGAQTVGMGRDLAEKYDVARELLAKADDQLGFALTEKDLVQHLPGCRHDAKSARANFDIEWAVVAIWHAVKLFSAVGDDAGQKVEAADGGFRTSSGRHTFRKGQTFHQGNDIDAAFFQHGTAFEFNRVHLKVCEALADGSIGPSEERGSYAVGNVTKA